MQVPKVKSLRPELPALQPATLSHCNDNIVALIMKYGRRAHAIIRLEQNAVHRTGR